MAKTKINEDGYVVFEDSGIPVHRWVAEKKHPKLKPLPNDLHVHHLNHDRRDNSPQNLIVLEGVDHYDLHQHENKTSFLIQVVLSLVIALYLIQFFSALISPIVIKTIGGFLIALIVLFLLELKNNFFSKMIRRPHEQNFD